MDIVQVLNDLNVPYCPPGQHHHVRQGWVGVDCPWCPRPSGAKSRWKLGIEISSGRCNCWTCGGHPLIKVLEALSNVSYGKLKSLVDSTDFFRPTIKPTRGRLKVPSCVGPCTAAHISYLSSRKLDGLAVSKLWQLGGIGIAGAMSWRVFIPVTVGGEVVTYTTRSIGDGGYISARPEDEDVPLKDTLYGMDLARNSVIVCEGP